MIAQQSRLTVRNRVFERDRTEIPVPAIISTQTFERAAQRLADNKRHASRNSKVPSLLQGLAAGASCGYGYYRTSTTTSSGKKISYYRCLGSGDVLAVGDNRGHAVIRLTPTCSKAQQDVVTMSRACSG